MGSEEQATKVVSELTGPIDQAVSKAYRRYGGMIERDELRSQAVEAVLVFAGLMTPDQRSYRGQRGGDAGKLTAWRQLPGPVCRTYLQAALDRWLQAYASHELEKRDRRVETIAYPDAALARAGWLADTRSADGYEAAELRLMLTHCPVLRYRYLHGISIRATAHRMRLTLQVARQRETEEKTRLKAGWHRDLQWPRSNRTRQLPFGSW